LLLLLFQLPPILCMCVPQCVCIQLKIFSCIVPPCNFYILDFIFQRESNKFLVRFILLSSFKRSLCLSIIRCIFIFIFYFHLLLLFFQLPPILCMCVPQFVCIQLKIFSCIVPPCNFYILDFIFQRESNKFLVRFTLLSSFKRSL